jgi:hypothetical protein
VNHISHKNGLELVGENGVLVDHIRKEAQGRFLPKPSAINWRTAFDMPDGKGRLYCNAQTAKTPEDEKIIRLDLSARGFSHDVSDAARTKWFDLAHEWITNGFVDITSPRLQKEAWGKIE